jgi:hypothetical protein
MKTIQAVTFGLLLMVPLAAIAAGDPALELSGAEFDFGLVSQNATYAHRVWLKVGGADTVEITSVKTGCGCLSAPMDSIRIAPGDSSSIVLYWQTRNSVGMTAKSAYLYTGDETRPLEAVLTASVVTEFDSAASISWAPVRVELAGRNRGEAPNKMFRLTNRTGGDLAVALVEVGDELDLQVPDSVAADQALTGFVALSERVSESDFESSFTLELTGNQRQPIRVSIPVVYGDFSFRPEFTTTKE